ncbi:hypothetical protein KAT63_02095 [Candidatus Parcubacteria bacterium]|nr:hypothetical protein [Candidatus Parcubacteria bacterium]
MRKNKKMLFNKFSCFFLVLWSVLAANQAIAISSIYISNPIATSDFSVLVSNFLKWILSVAGALTLLMLVTGGVFYVTSSGNEQKIETAKKMIIWTILGLMLILASYSIIVVLDKILT